jgi:hypothetical protein
MVDVRCAEQLLFLLVVQGHDPRPGRHGQGGRKLAGRHWLRHRVVASVPFATREHDIDSYYVWVCACGCVGVCGCVWVCVVCVVCVVCGVCALCVLCICVCVYVCLCGVCVCMYVCACACACVCACVCVCVCVSECVSV